MVLGRSSHVEPVRIRLDKDAFEGLVEEEVPHVERQSARPSRSDLHVPIWAMEPEHAVEHDGVTMGKEIVVELVAQDGPRRR